MDETGDRIRAARLQKRVNALRIAKTIGLSRAAYYKREATGNFTDEELEKIAALLKCPARDLRPNNGVAPEQERLIKDLARGLTSALHKQDLELDPEAFSELFNTLHRHFAFRGRVEPKDIDSIVGVIKKAAEAQSD